MPGRILSHVEGNLGLIVIDHPERRNAVSAAMWGELADAAESLDANPAVRVIVLRGAGELAFVSGADISEFESRRTGGAAAQVYEEGTQRAFGALGAVSKPLIAMIHGFCGAAAWRPRSRQTCVIARRTRSSRSPPRVSGSATTLAGSRR